MLGTRWSPLARAARHPLIHRGPAPDFFAGALLGNGGLGAVVCTRPDAVVVHFGHNNVWDIRVAERNGDQLGTFQEVFARVRAIPATHRRLSDDPWFRSYVAMARENYAKPYPRPFPCGSLILAFDRREVDVLGHELRLEHGLCRVGLLVRGRACYLEVFVDLCADRVWLRTVNAGRERPCAAPFRRVRLLPDPDTPREFPPFAAQVDDAAGQLAFRQVLPFLTPEDAPNGPTPHPKDRAFKLSARLNARLERRSRFNWEGLQEEMGALERAVLPARQFLCSVQLEEGLAGALPEGAGAAPKPTRQTYAAASSATRRGWADFWSRSGVRLEDELLERTWYRNLYFLNCAVRPGVTCPGLFANWSYRKFGSAWHGDYHLNYNAQQPFWGTFSCNHVEKHLPYVDMVDGLLPISRKWAREYYGLRGAFFPHSAYPVEMTVHPYPLPDWGWEVCETPWAVQSLWWHYRYTLDREFLERRAFGPIREAVLFLVDYLRRPDARGPQWGDDRYHLFPTVAPELFGLRPGFKHNHDEIVALALTRYVLRAFKAACAVLGREAEEAALLSEVHDVLAHLPPYPVGPGPRGPVFLATPDADPELVFNTPNAGVTVFPADEHGLHSPPAGFRLAARTWQRQQCEGGNELVFQNLQGARLGLLDLERFKREIEYCLLPNGTCTDCALQTGGRVGDTSSWEGQGREGVWFENFALPAVINECLLQSYSGELWFFPNWPKDTRAEFRTLRAMGAFLVSAAFARGRVQWIEVHSEGGAPLRLRNPWPAGARCRGPRGTQVLRGRRIEVATSSGETLRLVKA